jgi:hypothetical protein
LDAVFGACREHCYAQQRRNESDSGHGWVTVE